MEVSNLRLQTEKVKSLYKIESFACVVRCDLACLLGGFAVAQENLEFVLADLKAVQANEGASVDELHEAIANVQRIVDDFPASDAAVSILLGEAYDGIVFAAFEQRLKRTIEGQDDCGSSRRSSQNPNGQRDLV